MAFTIDRLFNDQDIEVIVKLDDALDLSDGGESYNAYLESGLDESKLILKEGCEPTRFVLRWSIPFRHATRIENAKMKYSTDGEITVQLGFIIEEIRACLKAVKNPPSVPKDKQIVLKFTGDGLVEEQQMAALISSGICQNLFAGRQAAMSNKGPDLKKS